MAFWDVDLSTRDGARAAARSGGVACFVMCGLAVLGAVLLATVLRTPAQTSVETISAVVGTSVEALVALIAGFRLRTGTGKGTIWGAVTAALLGFEIVYKLVMMSGFGGIVINGVILVFIINGVRAAFALKRGLHYDDKEVDAFS